jgi:hypothetical protein
VRHTAALQRGTCVPNLKTSLALLFLLSSLTFASNADAQQSESTIIAEPLAEPDLRLTASTGAIYSSGDYGGPENTDIVVVPFSLRLNAGDLRVSATLPYLRIDSPGNVVGGGDGPPIVIDPNVSSTRTVRDGFGDLSLGAVYTLPSDFFGALSVDLSGRVKLPTSSSKRLLGTGKTDFALAAEFSYPIQTWAPYVRIGYRFFGDLPGVNLKNGITTSVGTTKQFGRIVAIVSYDYSQATTAAVEDAHELFAALSGPLIKNINWTGYGVAGLSTGSPNFGLGLLLTVQIF